MKLANEMESAGMYLPFDYHEPSQRGSARGVSLEMMMESSYLPIRTEIAEIDNSRSPSARKCPGCVEPRHWLQVCSGPTSPYSSKRTIHVSFL